MAPWRAVFWDRLLTLYGRWTPYHPGKWWVIFTLEDNARAAWTGPRLVERRGTRYELDLRRQLERRMFYLDWHERSESRLIERMVKPGGIVIDAGSNFGYYALLLARLVGPTGAVYAFEPSSSNYRILQRNIALNQVTNVRTYRMALGGRRGEISLLLECPDNPGKTRIGSPGEQGSEMAPLTTLDQVVEEEKLTRVDFIKVDIEGSESDFLAGAQHTLKRLRPSMMVEIHPRELTLLGSSLEEFGRKLSESGYSLYRLGRHGALRPFGELSTLGSWLNAVALPQ